MMTRIIDLIINSSIRFSGRCSKMQLYVIAVLYMATLVVHSSSASSLATFSPSPVTTLRRLAVDRQSGRVYVGAVNHVYQLDSDLTLVVDVITGPVQDNKDCVDFDRNGNLDCSLPTSLVDNYNQVTVSCDCVH